MTRNRLFTAFLAVPAFSFITAFPGERLFGGESESSPINAPKGKPSPIPGTEAGNPERNPDFAAMRPATPGLLALYKARVQLYQKNADLILRETEGAGRDPLEAVEAAVARDEAKLAYWRREKNMRPAAGAAEAFVRLKAARIVMQAKKGEFQSGTLPLSELNKAEAKVLAAEIQMEEALLFVRDRIAWINATDALKNYPHKVTDELLRALLTAELP